MGGWGYVEVRLPKLCLTRISTEKLFGEGVAQVVCGRALGGASNSCVGGMHPCAAGGWGYIEVRLPKLCLTRISTENLFGEAVAQVVWAGLPTAVCILRWGCPFLAAVSYPQNTFLVPRLCVGEPWAGLLTAVWVGCIPCGQSLGRVSNSCELHVCILRRLCVYMCMCGQALGGDSVWVGEPWAGLSVRVPEGCFHSSEWPVVWASEQLHPKVEPLCSCYKAAVVSVSHSPIVCGKSWVQRSALYLM